MLFPKGAHADGGAPNLAYIAGTAHGISVIDIAKQKVTNTFAVAGDPQTVLLSIDGRLLYVTEPALKRVEIIATATKKKLCTAAFPGHPTLLTLDPGANTLYTAGNDAQVVEALDPLTCKIRYTVTTSSAVGGIAIAVVGSGISGGNGNQLWVATSDAVDVFDSTGKQLATVAIAGGPQYLTIPSGTMVYVTTRQGTVDAIDLGSRKVLPGLLTSGIFGPMDYDAITGEVYVPDAMHHVLDVLAPITSASIPLPHEPVQVIHLSAAPQSVAITSDGQLGFVALDSGSVVMLDIPGRQVVNTFQVGGHPHFIITGLYPSLLSLTPQQETLLGLLENLSHYIAIVVIVLAATIAIVVNRRKLVRSS